MNEIENELWPSTPQPKSKSEKSWRPNHEQEIQEAVCVGGRAYR